MLIRINHLYIKFFKNRQTLALVKNNNLVIIKMFLIY